MTNNHRRFSFEDLAFGQAFDFDSVEVAADAIKCSAPEILLALRSSWQSGGAIRWVMRDR
jgi:hypothetical protein